MPQSKQRRRAGHGEVIQPLSVLDRIDLLLKEHLSIFPSKPELTAEEIEHWHQDLNVFPLEAIEYAFNEWRRNGHFFPVYDDILQLCRAWQPPEKATTRCSADCQERHGKGYNTNDVLKLWALHASKRTELDRPLKPAEWNEILAQVDNWRGAPPEWRKRA